MVFCAGRSRCAIGQHDCRGKALCPLEAQYIRCRAGVNHNILCIKAVEKRVETVCILWKKCAHQALFQCFQRLKIHLLWIVGAFNIRCLRDRVKMRKKFPGKIPYASRKVGYRGRPGTDVEMGRGKDQQPVCRGWVGASQGLLRPDWVVRGYRRCRSMMALRCPAVTGPM